MSKVIEFFQAWWFVILPAAILFLFFSSLGSQGNHYHEEAMERLRWEKQKYQGDIAERLCREEKICEPLVDFKNRLNKELGD